MITKVLITFLNKEKNKRESDAGGYLSLTRNLMGSTFRIIEAKVKEPFLKVPMADQEID